MRRKLVLISLAMLGTLGLGCTSSDRDYVRNHIALASGKQQPLLLSSKVPPRAHQPR